MNIGSRRFMQYWPVMTLMINSIPAEASLPTPLPATPSTEVIERVATANGVLPEELDQCLYDVIDPDALDEIIASMNEGYLCFEFAGIPVTITSDGSVSVER